MKKIELMEKLTKPVIDLIKEEGLIKDIVETYKGDFIEFIEDFSHYFGAELSPLKLSYITNVENLSDKEKELALLLQDMVFKAREKYFNEDEEN